MGQNGKRKNRGDEDEKVEMAEVHRIVDERTHGRKQQYLCTWMDGGTEQWVDAAHLKGSSAEKEWYGDSDDDEELDSDASLCDEELFDPPEVVDQKCKKLKEWLKEAKRPVFMLGAGISAPVLPTFRGKGGLWTKDPQPSDKSCSDVAPTVAHKGLAELEKRGKVYWCATQNYDGLSVKSGFPRAKLSELHGNIFVEVCDTCGTQYERNFEVPLDDSVDHETGRFCEKVGCNGSLKDIIVHFDEGLPWKDLSLANAKFVGADLSVVLGSSLRVYPAAGLPFKAKKRRRFSTKPKAVIVNLQETPLDAEADLVIRATCDVVISKLLEE